MQTPEYEWGPEPPQHFGTLSRNQPFTHQMLLGLAGSACRHALTLPANGAAGPRPPPCSCDRLVQEPRASPPHKSGSGHHPQLCCPLGHGSIAIAVPQPPPDLPLLGALGHMAAPLSSQWQKRKLLNVSVQSCHQGLVRSTLGGSGSAGPEQGPDTCVSAPHSRRPGWTCGLPRGGDTG